VLFVTGAGHSGSTLLSFLLNTHPEIVAIGEMHAPRFPEDRPEARECSCGETMGRCPFLAAVGRRIEARGLSFDPLTWDLRYRAPYLSLANRVISGSLRHDFPETVRDILFGLVPRIRRERANLKATNAEFVRAALAATGKRFFVDASKNPMRIKFLGEIGEIDLRVVHLVRDPRGYAYSRKRDTGRPVSEVARDWRRVNSDVDRRLNELPADRWTRLRYEELCASPGPELDRVGALIGARPMGEPEDFRQVEHHIMGNKMRFGTGAPARVHLDERWREALTEHELRSIQSLCGSSARSYGYDI
jgi:hypothetical protein